MVITRYLHVMNIQNGEYDNDIIYWWSVYFINKKSTKTLKADGKALQYEKMDDKKRWGGQYARKRWKRWTTGGENVVLTIKNNCIKILMNLNRYWTHTHTDFPKHVRMSNIYKLTYCTYTRTHKLHIYILINHPILLYSGNSLTLTDP